MGKVDVNKQMKESSLLKTAFEYFTTKGFSKTSISDIVSKAGVAKGTFYLYFRDKTDIRDALIRAKASKLLQDAYESMEAQRNDPGEAMDAADKFIYIIDHIVASVAKDSYFVKFISKHLS